MKCLNCPGDIWFSEAAQTYVHRNGMIYCPGAPTATPSKVCEACGGNWGTDPGGHSPCRFCHHGKVPL